jgi:hypothetical protein
MHQPTRVRVRNEPVATFKLLRSSTNAFDVHVRVTANFELEPPISFPTILTHRLSHFLRGFLRYGTVEAEILAVTTAK